VNISCLALLRMRNVSEKSCREDQNTHFMFNIFLLKLCCLWDNVENCGTRHATDGNTIWHMCIACWITKAIDTRWKYVILICFAMATVVTWTHISIMFIHNLPPCYEGKCCHEVLIPWILNYWLPFIKTAR